jgi:hypothetical protein
LDYDNDALSDVRLPTDYSVPDHLLKEFKLLYPNAPLKKRKGKKILIQVLKQLGKFNLDPAQPIEGREREFINASWYTLKFQI